MSRILSKIRVQNYIIGQGLCIETATPIYCRRRGWHKNHFCFKNIKLKQAEQSLLTFIIIIIIIIISSIIGGVGLSPLGTAATSGLLYKPQRIDEGDCGAIGGMKIGRGNRSTRRKPAPAPLCSPQIPHDQTRARTRAAAEGSQRLTA
jgi:hypothetical protein